MTIESRELYHSIKDLTNLTADFGPMPLESSLKPGEAKFCPLETQVLADNLAQSLQNMQEMFRRLATSPLAGEFEEFFAHCREQASNNEPAYLALFGEKIVST